MREARSAAAAVLVLWLLAATDESAAFRDGAARHEDPGPLGRLAGSLRDRMLDVAGNCSDWTWWRPGRSCGCCHATSSASTLRTAGVPTTWAGS